MEDNVSKSRLRLRKSYFDGNKVLRKEERFPLLAASINLGFDYQLVLYDEEGHITSDLRTSPEELPNKHGYLSFLKTYGLRKKLLTGEIKFKTLRAKELGYTYSTVIYNMKGRPEKVLYFDQNKNKILTRAAR